MEVSTELYVALTKLLLMASPTVEDILRKRGFIFEAGVVAEVVAAWKVAR
jgi:hypothetical protein